MYRFWSIIYYFVHQANYRLSRLFHKMLGVDYFLSRSCVINFYKRRGVDIKEEFKNIYKIEERPDVGFSSVWARGGVMYSLIFMIGIAFICLYIGIFQIHFKMQVYPLVAVTIISYVINELYFFKGRKYLRYYKEMERMQGPEKKKWAWISLATVLGIWLFSIGCIIFMSYRI